MAPHLESDSSIYNEFMRLSDLLPAISSILLSKLSISDDAHFIKILSSKLSTGLQYAFWIKVISPIMSGIPERKPKNTSRKMAYSLS